MADSLGSQANTGIPDSEDQVSEELRRAQELRQQRRRDSPVDRSSLAQNVAQASKNKMSESFGGKVGQGEGMGTLSGGSPETLVRANKQYKQEKTMKMGMETAEKLKQGDIKGAIKGAVTAAAEMGGQLATGKILQFMWTNIYYVLPLLYIDFHFVMRYIAGSKIFCRLGEEWLQKVKGSGQGAATGVTKGVAESDAGIVGEVADTPNRALEVLEIIAMVLCNVIVIFALLCIWLLIYALATPCETLKSFGGILGKAASELLRLIGRCH